MRSLVPVLLLAGCYGPRIEEVRRDIEKMNGEIDATRGELEKVRKVFDRHNSALIDDVHPDPDGFDASRALPAQGRRPDVILLSIDTLRADHLGAWGYERDTSPFMDSLAAEGTRFASAWSPAPWTLPSHTTMLTGLYTRNHGAIEGHLQVPRDHDMLQEVFKGAGYRTGGAVGTLYVSSMFGFERGFDYFQDFGIAGTKANNSSTVNAEQVFNHALHWAQEQPAGEPIFLFLHVYDAHYGYNPPPPWDEKFDRKSELGDALYKDYFHYKQHPLPPAQMAHQIAQYDEEIAYVDDSFRQLIEKWRAERPNVVVSVTADHGEEFGERGSWGHAHTLFPEQLHVPWIVAGSGVRSQVVDQRVGTEDIAPTLAAMAGLDFPRTDGLDRSGQLRTGAPPRAPAGHVSGQYAATSRFETLRYRWHQPPFDYIADLKLDWFGLWNLADDPMERDNVIQDNPADAARLASELVSWLGNNWEATEAGMVFVVEEASVITVDGKRIADGQLEVQPGDRFEVHPKDAGFKMLVDGQETEPFYALGGSIILDSDPVRYLGVVTDNPVVSLEDSQQELLEMLGYLQGDEEPGGGDGEGQGDDEVEGEPDVEDTDAG